MTELPQSLFDASMPVEAAVAALALTLTPTAWGALVGLPLNISRLCTRPRELAHAPEGLCCILSSIMMAARCGPGRAKAGT
jgi:hypothetical protein